MSTNSQQNEGGEHMKAVFFEKYGGLEALKYGEFPTIERGTAYLSGFYYKT